MAKKNRKVYVERKARRRAQEAGVSWHSALDDEWRFLKRQLKGK